MAAATFDLTGDAIIEQNSYWSLILRISGNLEGAVIRGQIKRDFGGELLADFRLASVAYIEETDQTEFALYIDESLTKKIPVPVNNGFWRYDMVLFAPARQPIRLIQGRVFISAGITNV